MGARTKWHTHDSDQILYFSEGKGNVANEQEERVMTAGMIAVIAKGEKHWYGGTETTALRSHGYRAASWHRDVGVV